MKRISKVKIFNWLNNIVIINIYLVVGFIEVKLLVIIFKSGLRLFKVVVIVVKVENLLIFVVMMVNMLIMKIKVYVEKNF